MVDTNKSGKRDFETFIFDLDGVVYRGKDPIPAAVNKINQLQKTSRVLFLTNNSTKTRAQFAEKLSLLGVTIDADSIINSGYAAAIYIKENYPGQGVYFIGEEALGEELELQGVKTCQEKCGVVLVGLDFHFTYEKLAKALTLIRNGAVFIATNTDKTLITEGEILPGAGSIVSSVKAASGVEPILIGKPSKIIGQITLKKVVHPLDQVLMIGDRLETDIVLGKNLGIKTALVLTGISTEEDVNKTGIVPDFILDSL